MAFFMFVPVVSGLNIPMTIRLTLSICVSAVLFLSGAVASVAYNDTTAGYVILIVTEFMAGAFMGYMIFVIFNLIYHAGQLIDYEIGLSMMNVLDPLTQIQVPIVGNIYFLAVSALLVATGGLNGFIGAFYQSYEVLPLGMAHIVGNASFAMYAVTVLTEFMVLAVKIAMPVVGAVLVINVVLGIMVKTVPQINVFVVGMPLKLIVGIFLLFAVLSPQLRTIYEYVYDAAYDALINTIWGMAP